VREPPHYRTVNQPGDIQSRYAHPRLSRRGFDLLAIALVFTAYTLTLWVANALTAAEAVAAGAANTVPVILFGAAARRLILDHLLGRRLGLQMAGHAVLCAAYSLLAYWLVTVLLGLVNGTSPTEFVVQPFPSRAMAWQLLENATTYGIIAAISYFQSKAEPVAPILANPPKAGDGRTQTLSRYFIRSGDDIRPVDIGTIVSIAGADDYAEVATLDGRHLARLTLNEFEQSLDPARFIRIHRSRIVNIERIERAEPAGGGRLLLHMEDGEAIPASRTGSRLLRERLL
jgi:hypothetical protein